MKDYLIRLLKCVVVGNILMAFLTINIGISKAMNEVCELLLPSCLLSILVFSPFLCAPIKMMRSIPQIQIPYIETIDGLFSSVSRQTVNALGTIAGAIVFVFIYYNTVHGVREFVDIHRGYPLLVLYLWLFSGYYLLTYHKDEDMSSLIVLSG